MKNILLNNKILFITNIIIILFLFTFLLSKTWYSAVIHEDLYFFTSETINPQRMQVIADFISTLLISKIPRLLNINIQDFAIVSEVLYKTIIYIILSYTVAASFYKTQKKDFFFPIMIIIIFFSILSILSKYLLVDYFRSLYKYNETILPFIFFFLFFRYIYNFYILDKKIRKRDFVYLFIFSILLVTGNYVTFFVPFIFMLFLLIDLSLSQIIEKKYVWTSIISIFIMARHVFIYQKSSFNSYFFELNTNFSTDNIIHFLTFFFKYVIIENFFCWFLLFAGILYLCVFEPKDEKKIKLVRFICYIILSYIIFLLSTFLLKPNCQLYYLDNIKSSYWFMDAIIMFGFTLSIIYSTLLVWGSIIQKPKKLFTILIAVITLFVMNMYINNKPLLPMQINKEIKKYIYATEKITLFYLEKNKTAVLPFSYKQKLLLICVSASLQNNKQKKNKKYTIDSSFYLQFLKEYYKIDTTPGIIFKQPKEALKEFQEAGGQISKKELEELKFYKIRKYRI